MWVGRHVIDHTYSMGALTNRAAVLQFISWTSRVQFRFGIIQAIANIFHCYSVTNFNSLSESFLVTFTDFIFIHFNLQLLRLSGSHPEINSMKHYSILMPQMLMTNIVFVLMTNKTSTWTFLYCAKFIAFKIVIHQTCSSLKSQFDLYRLLELTWRDTVSGSFRHTSCSTSLPLSSVKDWRGPNEETNINHYQCRR